MKINICALPILLAFICLTGLSLADTGRSAERRLESNSTSVNVNKTAAPKKPPSYPKTTVTASGSPDVSTTSSNGGSSGGYSGGDSGSEESGATNTNTNTNGNSDVDNSGKSGDGDDTFYAYDGSNSESGSEGGNGSEGNGNNSGGSNGSNSGGDGDGDGYYSAYNNDGSSSGGNGEFNVNGGGGSNEGTSSGLATFVAKFKPAKNDSDSSHSGALMMVTASVVIGAFVGAVAIKRRKTITLDEHPLKGSISKRMKLFSHLADHHTSRPPRRYDEDTFYKAEDVMSGVSV